MQVLKNNFPSCAGVAALIASDPAPGQHRAGRKHTGASAKRIRKNRCQHRAAVQAKPTLIQPSVVMTTKANALEHVESLIDRAAEKSAPRRSIKFGSFPEVFFFEGLFKGTPNVQFSDECLQNFETMMKKKEEKEVKRHELISCEANDVEKKAIEIVEVCLKKDVDVRCSFANDELTISTTDVNNGVQEEHAKGQNDIENDKAINGRPNSSRSICKQQSESSSPSPSPSTTGSTGTNVHATEFVPVRSTIVKQSIALDPLTLANSNTTLISPNDCPNLNFHIPMSDGTMIPLDSHAPVPAIFSWPNVPYAAVNLPSPPMFFLVGADGMPVLGSMPLPWFATDTTTGEPVIMLPPAPDAVCGPPVHTEPSRPSVYALPPSLAQCFPFGCPRLGFGNALFVPVPHELWIACPLSPEVKAQYGW